MQASEAEVRETLDALKSAGLLRSVLPAQGKSVTRYRQIFDHHLGIGDAAASVLAVLMLRGPQTVAELRSRTERLHRFESAEDVEEALAGLATAGHVQQLDRQPGHKERRWQQLVSEEPAPTTPSLIESGRPDPALVERLIELEGRVARLEAALADLLPDP